MAGMIREIEAVLDEFGREPSALAAEIVRLREKLAQASLDRSIARAQQPKTIKPPER